MKYEFRATDGAVVEKDFPMSQAPDLGQVVEIDGLPCVRIVSVPAQVRGDPWKPYVSHRLPRGIKGVRADAHGRPIIETRAQERNVAAALGYERE
ncbi:MAG: hypothetical protein IT442_05040 [Phycisphaeraceae bacterium]|nr:hypothetical protein [Phycisphaeraceae bacterium]